MQNHTLGWILIWVDYCILCICIKSFNNATTKITIIYIISRLPSHHRPTKNNDFFSLLGHCINCSRLKVHTICGVYDWSSILKLEISGIDSFNKICNLLLMFRKNKMSTDITKCIQTICTLFWIHFLN